jgi:probable DNA repair protein
MLRLPPALDAAIGQGGTVVVPSRQRSHAVVLAHSCAQLAAGRRVWPTPDVLPLEGWLRRELERLAERDARLPRLLTPVQEWWLWRQCSLEATRDLPLVNRSALAEGLQHAAQLAADHRIDTGKWHALPGTESAVLEAVQRAVEARARDLGASPLARLTAMLPGIVSPGAVLFSGFVPSTPLLSELAGSRPPEAGLPGSLPAFPPARGTPQVVIAPDEDGELDDIARWCRAHARKDARARLLVMLPGPPGRRERLASLIRQSLDPGSWLRGDTARELAVIEGGSALAHLPLVAHALTSLALLCGRPLERAALGAWLAAPCWSHPSAARFPLLDLWLAEQGALQLTLQELLVTLRQAPAPLSGAARELARRLRSAHAVLDAPSASPQHWAQALAGALRRLGWPGARARDSSEQQTVERFMALLDEAGSLEAVVKQLTRDAAAQCLTELAARTAFAPADEDPLVTICPHLIDPVVTHDAIWVAGLTEDCLPLPVQPDPYLPLPAQREAQVAGASAAGRLCQARALLAAWRACCADLTLSAPARAGDLQLLPSPLLSAWPRRTPAPARASWLPLRLHREGQLETLEDVVGSPWPRERPLPSGTRALELQSQCPFRAYAELRLAARELRAPQPGVAPDARGRLLHGALQRLWSEVRDSRRLRALPEPDLDSLIERCVSLSAQQLQATRRQDAAQQRAFARERDRAARLLGELCRLERSRAPFAVEATELESHLLLGGRPLSVRIDRVDRLAGGGRAVLDYKSGRRTVADWHGPRPPPQLLTYLAALGGDVVALANVNINARELRFDGVAGAEGLLPGVKPLEPRLVDGEAVWEVQRRAWLSGLEHLAGAFVAGKAAVAPRPGACEHCHLPALCRIAERSAGAVIAEADGQAEAGDD